MFCTVDCTCAAVPCRAGCAASAALLHSHPGRLARPPPVPHVPIPGSGGKCKPWCETLMTVGMKNDHIGRSSSPALDAQQRTSAFKAEYAALCLPTSLMLRMEGYSVPRARSSSVTSRATASAAAMNCSSRSFVQALSSTPRPTPAQRQGTCSTCSWHFQAQQTLVSKHLCTSTWTKEGGTL